MSGPKLESMSIVLVGNFNPVIFQPAWLAANGLLPAEEVKDPKVQVIHPDLASFTADWVNVQVVPTRFQALTMDAARYEPLKDLVVGIFALLEHAPFTQMGINCDAHFEPPQDVRDRIGDALAPKPPWTSTMQEPKLWSLVMAGKPNSGEAQISGDCPAFRERTSGNQHPDQPPLSTGGYRRVACSPRLLGEGMDRGAA